MKAHVAIIAGLVLWAGCPDKQRPTPDQRVPDSGPPAPPLKITDISFAGPAGHRQRARFARGETITCLFSISGFVYRDGKAHIVADVGVKGPHGQRMLEQPGLTLVEGKAPSKRAGTIRSAATITLSPAAPAGEHRVTLTVRDVLGGGQGVGHATLELLGPKSPPRAATLTIAKLQAAADDKVPPGSALPLAFEVRGVKTAPGSKTAGLTAPLRRLHLSVHSRLESPAGESISTHDDTLSKTELPFEPRSVPVEHVVLVPAGLSPGPYRLALAVKDNMGGGTTRALFRFQVIPQRFGVFNLHLHDAAGLPRESFLPGEQVFVRLSVHGLKQNAKHQVDASVDLAVAGPRGGVHLARKAAAQTSGERSQAVARAGRFPVELPLPLPQLCASGEYRLVVRARDRLARRDAVGERRFRIEGDALPPLSKLKLDQLQVRQRADLPPTKGDTFRRGKTYQLTVRLGGAELKELKKLTYRVRLKGELRLKAPGGKLVHREPDLFRYERTFTFRPLRILIPLQWSVPPNLAPGLYDLELVALDQQNDNVSQLMRRVEIVP